MNWKEKQKQEKRNKNVNGIKFYFFKKSVRINF